MQTLRKKTSPLKYKNETSRFLGEGVSFKAKLIGILEVSEARGDRMCQEALSDLKMAIRAAGEHKQRITINIAIDGLRLRDEKTGDSLYHHPVHKISFIAQDMSDSRAFGYIFGSPDTGHRFFGIKTDKAASQVVIAMRDLFQVVFALKKKEIEMAKQHLDKSKYSSSPLFSERNLNNLKSNSQDTSKVLDTKGASSSAESRPTPAVADLVDLELELNSLQQGLHQMERITPSDPFGRSEDPFGDSFTSFPKPILPPPPSSGRDRSTRVSESSSIFSPKTPHTAASCDSSSAADLLNSSRDTPKDFSFNEFNSSHDEPSSGDWFTPPAGNSLFEDAPAAVAPEKEKSHEQTKHEIMSQFDVFTDLDPLGTKNYDPTIGTGKIRPYVDKKHFFQELKNPPKKVLNDLVSESSQPCVDTSTTPHFQATFTDQISSSATSADAALLMNKSSSSIYNNDPFGEDPFDQTDPFADADFSKNDVFESDLNEYKLLNSKLNDLSSDNKIINNGELGQIFKTEFTFPSVSSTGSRKLFENPSIDLSSESECAPEPPPRPANTLIKPPPLPPKKQGDLYKAAMRDKKQSTKELTESHYDYIDKYRSGKQEETSDNPPIPAPARKRTHTFEAQFEGDYLRPISRPLVQPPSKSHEKTKSEPSTENLHEPDLNLETLDITLSQLTLSGLNELAGKLNIPASQLNNMTLAQLTDYLSNFIKNSKGAALASSTVTSQEQEFASSHANPENKFESDFNFADFNQFNDDLQNTDEADVAKSPTPNDIPSSANSYDRYAVFRELIDEAKETPKEFTSSIDTDGSSSETVKVETTSAAYNDQSADRYAALREIVDSDIRASQDVIEEGDEEDENQLETIDEVVMEQNNLNEDKTSSVENDLNVVQIIAHEVKTTYDIENNEEKVDEKLPEKEMDSLTIKPSEHVTSRGSLSDVVSGSSPEVENGSLETNDTKNNAVSGESWAIFDQTNLVPEETKDPKAAVQSEEGVSPWSSDSKEFGNGSPPPTNEWHNRRDSGSGGEHWNGGGVRPGRNQEGWWDTSAEPETPYYNRRSTDSYEDECYDCYERPRRRRQGQGTWNIGGPGGPTTPHGGHSSSSRDVSPWEEEPRRRGEPPPGRPGTWSSRHSRHSFDRHSSGRDSRRHTDSWDDEDDDYEYEDEQRFHWPERHGDRHPTRSEMDDWDERRMYQKRRRDVDRDRWCCPDYNVEPEPLSRYNMSRWSNPERRPKHDERYYGRGDSNHPESPWEDDYSNEVEPHYLTARRIRIRPSSASEMDRKTGEIKARPGQFHFGGSDGERERRYKTSRRSKSRDSPQYTEPSHVRHKPAEPLALRTQLRKQHPNKFDDYEPPKRAAVQETPKEVKTKPSSLAGRKKTKESPKTDEANNTFPRKSSSVRGTMPQSLFENDFVSNQVNNGSNRFESTDESNKWFTEKRGKTTNLRYKQKSLFEDDFSPTEPKDGNTKVVETIETIHSIKEEVTDEGGDSLGTNIFDRRNSKKRLSRISQLEGNLKKSESVNIFSRENDPFDDDFFCEKC